MLRLLQLLIATRERRTPRTTEFVGEFDERSWNDRHAAFVFEAVQRIRDCKHQNRTVSPSGKARSRRGK